jgi:SAM-dependent methyltransferase
VTNEEVQPMLNVLVLRSAIKRVPGAISLKRTIWDGCVRTGVRALNRTQFSIIEGLPAFAPDSSGDLKSLAKLTLLSANQIFPLLQELLERTERHPLLIINAEDFVNSGDGRTATEELKNLLNSYGSDKASIHNYHLVYGEILAGRGCLGILEIGLGTKNRDTVSHMGEAGTPGGSLRAFKAFLPGAQIYGADVDRRILFQEDRIKTFFVDQTDLNSFEELERNIDGKLDLIIDDGLHAPNANLAVLVFSIGKLKAGGWLVIEDINEHAVPIWQVVASILPDNLKPHLIRTRAAFVFAVRQL